MSFVIIMNHGSQDRNHNSRHELLNQRCTRYNSECGIDVLSVVNGGDSLLCQQLALLITSVDSCR